MINRLRVVSLILVFTTFSLILAGCDGGGAPPLDDDPSDDEAAIPQEATAWLNESAHPLTTADPEAPLDDLSALGDLIGDARVVSLGEATHGTREFFQMKHRILRYLVEEKGFTAFAIEATMPESFRMNDYVQRGDGDARERLADLRFWTWNTRTVLDQVEWMRDYNASGPDSLGFYGFDMQYPVYAMDVVEAFVADVNPDTLAWVQANYDCYRTHRVPGTTRYENLTSSYHDTCGTRVDSVATLLDAQTSAYTAASNERKMAFVRQHARIVDQSEHRDTIEDPLESVEFRDRAMADNTLWLLDWLGPDAKIVLWAHNNHVSESGYVYTSMGSHLATELGDDLFTVGFSFYEGRVTAVQFSTEGWSRRRSISILSPPSIFKGSDVEQTDVFENYFHTADASSFLLDLNAAEPGSDASGWVTAPKHLRTIGAGYEPEQAERYFTSGYPIVESFDALIHVDRSTATEVLPQDGS